MTVAGWGSGACPMRDQPFNVSYIESTGKYAPGMGFTSHLGNRDTDSTFPLGFKVYWEDEAYLSLAEHWFTTPMADQSDVKGLSFWHIRRKASKHNRRKEFQDFARAINYESLALLDDTMTEVILTEGSEAAATIKIKCEASEPTNRIGGSSTRHAKNSNGIRTRSITALQTEGRGVIFRLESPGSWIVPSMPLMSMRTAHPPSSTISGVFISIWVLPAACITGSSYQKLHLLVAAPNKLLNTQQRHSRRLILGTRALQTQPRFPFGSSVARSDLGPPVRE
ncbi:conserved hypothetical protein [Microsporum canis CBS 113480]|uniref:Uncharacterized protein n=1 Tax=Arthroderma otae (strain ATCC MYA-4605 / CBS 113480) TaxID=554155 RepID=C5FLE5_ARTOC|nr:conserved hypothetical protein [Microsporum canis CBS 113480]EEQ30517.1 conserved hypothetical protein [Microsporum canis CBS 113480]